MCRSDSFRVAADYAFSQHASFEPFASLHCISAPPCRAITPAHLLALHNPVMHRPLQETHSIFSVDLGNLEAHTEAVVRLSYLRRLDRIAFALEYCHTATWVPPCVGSAGDRTDGPDKVRTRVSRAGVGCIWSVRSHDALDMALSQ